jgi:hypothetical protein
MSLHISFRGIFQIKFQFNKFTRFNAFQPSEGYIIMHDKMKENETKSVSRIAPREEFSSETGWNDELG